MPHGFLCISRNKGESIIIFDEDSKIEIKVNDIWKFTGRERVSLAIKAPKKYKIIREPM